MGAFRRKSLRRSSSERGVAPIEVLLGTISAAEQRDLPFADSLGSFVRAYASPQTVLITEAVAKRENYDFERQAHMVVWEAFRQAIHQRDQHSTYEISTVGTLMLVRWHRYLMDRNLTPPDFSKWSPR